MRGGVFLLWAVLSGCEPLGPADVEDVVFDEGVRLDTHRTVAFEVAAGFPADATLRVRLEDGFEVYSGPASIPMRRALDVRVPQDARGVWVAVERRGSEPSTLWVEVTDARIRLAAEDAS